jgi:hypothetical protein
MESGTLDEGRKKAMKTRDELKKELEEDADIFCKYLSNVTVIDETATNSMAIIAAPWGREFVLARIQYKPPHAPRGEVCLCWSKVTPEDKRPRISLGDGRFICSTSDIASAAGTRWDNWESLGINVLDEIDP